jgi:Uma2 family endonuclease
MVIDAHDVEKLQALYPENRIELREGRIIIMSPSDFLSSEVGANFIALLKAWVRPHRAGRVVESSAGFRLPNGDVLAPDVSFVSFEKLKKSPRTFATVVPELIVEIKSSTDRVRELEEKIALFLRQGVQVGILIDPDKQTVGVYRSRGLRKDAEGEDVISPVEILRDEDRLSIPDLFPGWEIAITEL